jgi:glycosyltransferase involved in cell wall biosynthesis
MVRTLGQGGTERQVAELAKALDRASFTPHVACFVGGGHRFEELRERGVPLVEIPLRSLVRPSVIEATRRLRRYLREKAIGIVHTFDFPANIFGVPAARALGTPVVLGSQRGYRSVYPPRYRFLLRLSDRLAHGIVVNCEAMRRHLMEDYAVPPGKIHLCHNGIDTGVFRPAPRERPPQLQGARLVIGAVSALRPEKGIPVLVEAFAQAARERPGIRLLIVGDGPEREGLEARARELGIAGEVIFEPSTSQVARWLHSIDVFVLPSLSEAFSNSLMEAMACGCAVVASRVGGNPELVQEGETGLLFERANAGELAQRLIAPIDDEALRRRLASNAAHSMERYSSAASAERMQGIYESFLRKRGARPLS